MPKRKTLQEFVDCSIKIHGDRYNYSKVEYKSNKHKVVIICKSHGEFLQTPNDHIGGHGCRKCSEENQLNYNLKEAYSEKNKDYLLDFYVLDIIRENDRFLKVGISKQVDRRIFNIKTKSRAKEITPLLIYPCTLQEATLIEDRVIRNLKIKFKVVFDKKFSGYSECLLYDSKDSILQEIQKFILEQGRSDIVARILEFEYGK
jgi:hypothetical protein